MKSFPSPLHQKSDHRGKLLEELTCNRYYSSVFECFCLASFFFSKVRVSSHRGYGFFPSGPPLKTVTFRERNCIAKMGGGIKNHSLSRKCRRKAFSPIWIPPEPFWRQLMEVPPNGPLASSAISAKAWRQPRNAAPLAWLTLLGGASPGPAACRKTHRQCSAAVRGGEGCPGGVH